MHLSGGPSPAPRVTASLRPLSQNPRDAGPRDKARAGPGHRWHSRAYAGDTGTSRDHGQVVANALPPSTSPPGKGGSGGGQRPLGVGGSQAALPRGLEELGPGRAPPLQALTDRQEPPSLPRPRPAAGTTTRERRDPAQHPEQPETAECKAPGARLRPSLSLEAPTGLGGWRRRQSYSDGCSFEKHLCKKLQRVPPKSQTLAFSPGHELAVAGSLCSPAPLTWLGHPQPQINHVALCSIHICKMQTLPKAQVPLCGTCPLRSTRQG